MPLTFAALALTAALTHPTILPAERNAHVLVVKTVFLNGHGPYKMMIDTGASSCAIRPSLAAALHLRPTYAVEMATSTGTQNTPATAVSIRAGNSETPAVETLITDLRLPGVDGVLGQSWLAHHDYTLDYRHRRLILNPPPPTGPALRAPLSLSEGRPAIHAAIDGHPHHLILDSGSAALILFGAFRFSNHATLGTHTGATQVTTGQAQVAIAGARFQLPAAAVPSAHRPGLLPTSAFQSIYISNRNRQIALFP